MINESWRTKLASSKLSPPPQPLSRLTWGSAFPPSSSLVFRSGMPHCTFDPSVSFFLITSSDFVLQEAVGLRFFPFSQLRKMLLGPRLTDHFSRSHPSSVFFKTLCDVFGFSTVSNPKNSSVYMERVIALNWGWENRSSPGRVLFAHCLCTGIAATLVVCTSPTDCSLIAKLNLSSWAAQTPWILYCPSRCLHPINFIGFGVFFPAS